MNGSQTSLRPFEDSAADVWDAVVVGAGPAGGVCAALLARAGRRVLLLERSAWPRDKVCGGCVSSSAAAALRNAGLGDVLRPALALDDCLLRVPGRQVSLPLHGGAAISRADLDRRLADRAVRWGATFLPSASARLLPDPGRAEFRRLLVRMNDAEREILARIVLACDGINGTLLRDEPWAVWRIAPEAWIGVAATLSPSQRNSVEPGVIEMHVGDGGYAGMVRRVDGTVHIAAAIDPETCRRIGPHRLIERITGDRIADLAPGWRDIRLHGTGPLTRTRRALGGWRILAVGDACGYVEPFTGEGIEWAIAGATAVVDLLPAPDADWPASLPARWRRRHRQRIGIRHWRCRAIRFGLHRPLVARIAAAAIATAPALAACITDPRGVSFGPANLRKAGA